MFCKNCGNQLINGNRYCSFCGADQQLAASSVPADYTTSQPLPMKQQTVNRPVNPPMYQQPPMSQKPQKPQKPVLVIVAIITAVVVVVVCTASYFLFFAVKPTDQKESDLSKSKETAEAVAEVTKKTNADVDYAATRDVADLVGVWEGELEYTEISGDWDTFTYPVSQGYIQPFMLKITDGSPELNWRQAILRIDGGDAAVLNAGFEARFLEIQGEWQSCDVSISVEYDEERGGFTGIGEYIHTEKHASFDFFMTQADEKEWDSTDAPAVTEVQTAPTPSAEMVSAQNITVSMAYDSGEGIYTGEVKDGVPHGLGSFEMLSSGKGSSWSYEGQWENGEVTGEGTMTQGTYVFVGGFKSGLLTGSCEITDNGVLRYRGMCQNGKLHGQGTLYAKSGMLLFEGTFDNDMLVESAAARQARGESFIPECDDMDEMLYEACMAEDNTFGYPVAAWGFSLAMGEQTANGTIVIGHMGNDSYPICLVYRYGLDEHKMNGDDWINAWGVVGGTYEYVDADGLTVTCPMIEVVCWNNEQEGL